MALVPFKEGVDSFFLLDRQVDYINFPVFTYVNRVEYSSNLQIQKNETQKVVKIEHMY